MINDIISDLLTRIRNALRNNSDFVLVIASKLTFSILELLKIENFIKDFKVIFIKKRIYILILLSAQFGTKTLRFSNLRRISKSSLKIFITKYQEFSKISTTSSVFSLFIISTSYGLLTSQTAKTLQIGGEILFQIELVY